LFDERLISRRPCDHDFGALRRLQHLERPVEALLLELGELAGDLNDRPLVCIAHREERRSGDR